MKFVRLMILAMILSQGAAAQTTGDSTGKSTAMKTQQKTKKQKAKPSVPKSTTENQEVTTLTDDKSHKAKRSFEEVLRRRLEFDAQEAERKHRKE